MRPFVTSHPQGHSPLSRSVRLVVLTIVLLGAIRATTGLAQGTDPDPALVRLESALAAMVNAERMERGRPGLAYSAALADVARSHSRDMATRNFFSHRSPTTGQSGDRLFKAKIGTKGSAENIAKNSTIERSHEALMKSPGHKANILHHDYTHIGIGLAKGPQGQLYVTQNFATLMPAVDLARARADAVNQINQVRATKRLSPVAASRTLMSLAQANSDHMNRMQDVTIKRSVRSPRRGTYKGKRTTFHVLLVPNLAQLTEIKECLHARASAIGVGLTMNETKRRGYGMLWVTVICVQQ